MGYPLLLLFLFLAFISPVELIPELAVIRPSAILAVLGIFAAALALLGNQKPLALPQIYLMLGFALWVTASWPLHGWLGGAITNFQYIAPQTVTLILTMTAATTLRRLRGVGWLMAAISLYFVFHGLAAYHFGVATDKYALFQPEDWDPDTGEPSAGRWRIIGTGVLGDPNDLAQFFLISLPLLWASWQRKRLFLNYCLILPATTLIFYGVWMTGSRGALAGILIIAIMLMREHAGTIGALLSGTVPTALLIALGYGGSRALSATSGTGGSRLELWSESLGAFKSNPIMGVGFNQIQDYLGGMFAHNSFVHCLVELGLIGYFFWLGLLVISIQYLIILQKALPRPAHGQIEDPLRRQVRMTAMAFYAYIATAWFLSRTYVIVLYLLIGMAANLYTMHQEQRPLDNAETGARTVKWLSNTLVAMVLSIFAIWMMVRVRWA